MSATRNALEQRVGGAETGAGADDPTDTAITAEAPIPTSEHAAAPKLVIDHVSKVFEARGRKRQAVNDVSLEIAENEFVTVVGPSGCGKSTLLNIIAGLEDPTTGEVRVDGVPVTGPGPERGVVFQQYALFPWLTVAGNVAFGLRLRHAPKQEVNETVARALETVGLSDFASAYPKELSGGMRQRVAIARAYAVDPQVLLMDEPFGALDAQTRTQLQQDLLATWQRSRKTCFFITHDVEEAVILAQRVVVMSARPGRVVEVVDIDLPYPRPPEMRTEPAFLNYKNRIWNAVYREFLTEPKDGDVGLYI